MEISPTQIAPPAQVQLVQVRSAYGIANTLAAPAGYVVAPAGPVPGATLGLSAAAQALLRGRVTSIQVIEAEPRESAADAQDA